MLSRKEKLLAAATSLGIITCPVVAHFFPFYLNLFPIILLFFLTFKVAPLRLRLVEIVALCMFIILAFISILINSDISNPMVAPFLTIITSLAVILFISKLNVRENAFVSELAKYTIWVSCLVSFACVAVEMFRLPEDADNILAGSYSFIPRASGFFNEPVDFAITIAIFTGVYINSSSSLYSRKTIGIAILGVVASQSLTGLVLFYFVLISLFDEGHAKKFAYFSALLGLLASVIFLDRILAGLSLNDSSGNVRLAFFNTAFQMIDKQNSLLFGLGPGAFRQYFGLMDIPGPLLGYEKSINPTSIFLIVLVEYGLAGLLCFMAILSCVVRTLKSAIFISLLFLSYGTINLPALAFIGLYSKQYKGIQNA